MTTPPPPPPPPPSDAGDWPASQPNHSQPSQSPQPSQPSRPSQAWPPSQPSSPEGGRQKWWTGGRILAAIVIVLVLMGVSAVGGFVAGSTWGTIDTFADGFDTDGDFPFDGDVPGFVAVDTPATEGEPVEPGSRVEGVVDQPVEHALTLTGPRDVALEITDADFDTVLVVLDDAGEVVEADDDGGESTNSAMQVSLAAGTYQVRVQPWGEGAGGAYTLAVD